MSATYSPRRRLELAPVVGLAAVAYFVLIGGTPAGDVSAPLRVLNGAIGAAVIGIYLVRMPRESDLTDRLVLLAVLVYLIACVTSIFPRQSLEVALTVLAYAGTFYIARRLAADPRIQGLALTLLASICLIMGLLFAAMWGSEWVEWLSITGGSSWPPLGLSVPARHFGNQHDVAVLVFLLLPASWALARTTITRGMAILASMAALVLALVGGSRNVWLAAVIAAAVVAATHPTLARRLARSLASWRAAAVATAGVAILVVATVAGLTQAIGARAFNLVTVGQRAERWAGSLDVWIDRPLTGAGPGSFALALPLGDYFQTNRVAPRHPDSAAAQLLVEAGLLGIVAVAIVCLALLVGIRTPRWRPTWQSLWAPVFFVAAGIGANPSDFGFLVVPAIVWAALAAPRAAPTLDPPPLRLPYASAAGAMSLVLLVAFALTSIATIAYASARSELMRDDLPSAERSLSVAVAADPQLALYWRERGIIRLLLGKTDGARADLATAVRIAPTDDAALRALAMADLQGGRPNLSVADQAVWLRPLGFHNQVVRLLVAANLGDSAAAREAAVMLVLISPQSLADPAWASVESSTIDRHEALLEALERWETDQINGEGRLRWAQAPWLAGLAGRQDLFQTAAEAGSEDVWLALQLALTCRTSEGLAIVQRTQQQSGAYWNVRLIAERLAGLDAAETAQLGSLISEQIRGYMEGGTRIFDPLGNQRLDEWYYRREFIVHPPAPGMPGFSDPLGRWLLQPAAALTEATGRRC